MKASNNLLKILADIASKQKKWIPIGLILATFIIGVLAQAPIRKVFEYNRDEGYTLMGASLLLKGFSLYREIWLDQTPLFIVTLAYWLKLFGASVYHGRILVLIFSTILLWAFYQTIKTQWGRVSAFMAVVFLVLSNTYLNISVSVMIGIPSLTFLMLSVYCVTLYKKVYAKYLLVLSGIFMALSLQTKLFTIFLMPFIALEINQIEGLNLKGERERGHSQSLLFLWFGSFLVVFLVITMIFFHFDVHLLIKQLVQSHFMGAVILRDEFPFLSLWNTILTDYDIGLLALMGAILLIREKRGQSLFPVLWLVSALVILFYHRPIFCHYYPLVSIPMCWLAAISFGEFFRVDIRQGWWVKKNKYNFIDITLRWLTATFIALSIVLMPIKYFRTHVSLRGQGEASPAELTAVNLLMEYKPYIDWVITDRPIFAFYANMVVPPEFAIICHKRRFIDEAAQNEFIVSLQKYKAKLILLNAEEFFGPKVIAHIEEKCDTIYQAQIPSRLMSVVRWNLKPTNIKSLLYATFWGSGLFYPRRNVAHRNPPFFAPHRNPVLFASMRLLIPKDLSKIEINNQLRKVPEESAKLYP